MKFISFVAALFLFFLAFGSSLDAQTLSIFSGNGQVVQEQFLTSSPLVVQAKDAAGRPAAGVSISWTITQGSGTLVNAMTTTDANGQASTNFLGTTLQSGTSFLGATITASSTSGSVNLIVTTVPNRSAPPLVVLVTPPIENRFVSGRAGSTLPGAVVVQVIAQSGIQQGQPIPNVGVQIVNLNDPDPTLPSAMCSAPGGLVLTDARGLATCDLVLGPRAGTVYLAANGGGFQNTPLFRLEVTPGAACTFALSASNQTFTASGGMGTVSVTTPTGCGWTASSSANWITINSGASGSTNGNVSYTVAANTGAARSGTLLIAGQTYTVNQAGISGGVPSVLTITTGSNLPSAPVGIGYGITLAATGGQPPYTWSSSGTLPPGLSLNGSTGILSGTPTVVGNYNLSATVADSQGRTQSQTFSLAVVSNSTSLTITTSGFPNGVAGQAYQQPLTSSGGCMNPFSPTPSFSLAGGALPAGLTLQQIPGIGFGITGTPTTAGTSNFTVAVQDACGAKITANFTLTIVSTSAGAVMAATPAALTFNAQAGGNLNFHLADQNLSITSSGTPLQYTATASITNGGNWLVLTSPTGTTPGTITVSAVTAQLAAGSYSGTISIASGASNSPVTVPVTLTITAAPLLTATPTALTFTQPASGGTVVQQSIVINSGGVPAHYTATANTVNGGSWLFLNTNSGDTPGTLLASVNSAGLAPGSYAGSILIMEAGGGSQFVAVTLTVPASAALTVTPATLTFTAGRGAVSVPAQTLALSSTAGATSFATSTVTTTGNWLSVVPQNGITPAVLSVVVTPAALPLGSYSGTITITPADASIPPLTVSVSLTIGTNTPLLRAITNAASFAPGPIAPGEIVTLFGSGLGPQALAAGQLDANGNLATVNTGTQVLFEGIPAPIIYTSDTQVSAIVPYDLFGRTTAVVQVVNLGVASNSIELHVVDTVPAIFTLTSDGQGAILNQDGSVNFPQTGADPGSYVSLFATGEGQTDPAGSNGKIITADVLPRPRLPVTVHVAGQQADVLYAGGAPGLAAGLLQVNVHLPDKLPHGSQVPVVLTVGDQSSPTVFLSVK